MSILVVAEQHEGKLHPQSLEAIVAGQQLASQLSLPLDVTVLAAGPGPATEQLARVGCHAVYLLLQEAFEPYRYEYFVAALASLIEELQPRFVVFPHTYQTRDYAPRIAARWHRPLLSDVIGFELDGETLLWTRPLFQGKLLGKIKWERGWPVFVSTQSGAFPAEQLQAGTPEVKEIKPELDGVRLVTQPGTPYREVAQGVDLSRAERIVAAGRGIQSKENLALIEKLAQLLRAEIAASRPVVDSGWLPPDRQVGSSGQIVRPKLYVAVGISGAIQHLVGMKGAETIVAINKDREAPIFEVADYGVVGDLFEIVPALIKELEEGRSQG